MERSILVDGRTYDSLDDALKRLFRPDASVERPDIVWIDEVTPMDGAEWRRIAARLAVERPGVRVYSTDRPLERPRAAGFDAIYPMGRPGESDRKPTLPLERRV
jgi:hypothetical protein